MKWVGCGRKQSWPNLGYYISTEGVGIACWTGQGSVPSGSHKIFSSPLLYRLPLWPTKPPVQRYWGSSPGVKWLQHGTDYPSPYKARVNDE